jgi:hypothetical protein
MTFLAAFKAQTMGFKLHALYAESGTFCVSAEFVDGLPGNRHFIYSRAMVADQELSGFVHMSSP